MSERRYNQYADMMDKWFSDEGTDKFIVENKELFKRLNDAKTPGEEDRIIKEINAGPMREKVLSANLSAEDYDKVVKDFPIYDDAKELGDWKKLKSDSNAIFDNDKPLQLTDTQIDAWARKEGVKPEYLKTYINNQFLKSQKQLQFDTEETLKEEAAKQREADFENVGLATELLGDYIGGNVKGYLKNAILTGEGPTSFGEMMKDPEFWKNAGKDAGYTAVTAWNPVKYVNVAGKLAKAGKTSKLVQTASKAAEDAVGQAAYEAGREATNDYEKLNGGSIGAAGTAGAGASALFGAALGKLGQATPQMEEAIGNLRNKLLGKEKSGVFSEADQMAENLGRFKQLSGGGNVAYETAKKEAADMDAIAKMTGNPNERAIADFYTDKAMHRNAQMERLKEIGIYFSPEDEKLVEKFQKFRKSNNDLTNLTTEQLQKSGFSGYEITKLREKYPQLAKNLTENDAELISLAEFESSPIITGKGYKGKDWKVREKTNFKASIGETGDGLVKDIALAGKNVINKATPRADFLNTRVPQKREETQDQKYQRWQKGFQTAEEMQSPEYKAWKEQNLKNMLLAD